MTLLKINLGSKSGRNARKTNGIPETVMLAHPPHLVILSQSVFPVPPLQKSWVVLFVGGVIHSAAKGVEKTAVNRCALLGASFRVEPFRIFSFEVGDLPDAEFVEIRRDAFAHTGYGLKFFENRLSV